MDITKEIEALAENMEKSMTLKDETMMLLKAQIAKMGSSDLRKVAPTLNAEQKELLKSVLEEMKKQKKELSTEPASQSSEAGRMEENTDKPKFDTQDEKVMDEAEKRKQMSHRNQGGAPIEGWEGQIIKAEEMSAKQEAHEKAEDKELKDIKAAEGKMEKLQSDVEKSADGDSSYGVDGDNFMKKQGVPKGVNPEKHEEMVHALKREGYPKESAYAITNAKLKKDMEMYCSEDHEHTAECKLPPKGEKLEKEEEKEAVKKSIHKIVKRMQEKGMKKEECVPAFAKSLGASETAVAKVWEALAKSERYKYDDGTVGENISEGEQSDVPEQMKKDMEGAVHDPDSVEVPAYRDAAAKKVKKEKEEKPLSGEAKEEADEMTREVPETMSKLGDMKKSIYHEESVVYAPKKNPLLAKSLHYSVDSYIASEESLRAESLAKSTFLYDVADKALRKSKEVVAGNPGQEESDETKFGPEEAKEQSKLPEWMDESKDVEALKEAAKVIKPDDEMQHFESVEKAYMGFKKLEGKLAARGDVKDPAAVAAAIGRKKYGAKKFNAAAHEGHKMGHAKKLHKSMSVSEMIEKGMDMDDLAVEHKKEEAKKPAKKHEIKMVKSFDDTEMEGLFAHELEKAKKMEEEKAEKEAKAKKKKDLKKDWMY
jgi:hypothetical protein